MNSSYAHAHRLIRHAAVNLGRHDLHSCQLGVTLDGTAHGQQFARVRCAYRKGWHNRFGGSRDWPFDERKKKKEKLADPGGLLTSARGRS